MADSMLINFNVCLNISLTV